MWTSDIKARFTSFDYQLFTEETIPVHPTVGERTGGMPKNDHVAGADPEDERSGSTHVQGFA
jgi:hypothetical protein